mmetsp:Transcript_1427/g.2275  ORF Transcript_1427/g.2275 Transcript_1427/m.2275 type:complete len:204 (+) Transcript_1427:82-693(+)
MIIHGNIKQIIATVPIILCRLILAPGKTMTMRVAFVLPCKNGVSRGNIIRAHISAHINITYICIVHRIAIETIGIIWRGTVPIGIICLTILHPTTHGCTDRTILKVFHFMRKLNATSLSHIIVNILNTACIIVEYLCCCAITAFEQGLTILVPVCTAIEVLLEKCIGFGIITEVFYIAGMIKPCLTSMLDEIFCISNVGGIKQ